MLGLCVQALSATASLKQQLSELPDTSEFAEIIEKLEFWNDIDELDGAVVLVPNNAAMAAFPEHLKNYYFSDTAQSREKLSKQIAYHVLPGASEISADTLGKYPSMHGSNVLIERDEDGGLMVDASRILSGPYAFDKGKIYIIERFIFSNIWK
ncbi:MAG: fasciclin domain-containing protein [Opitutales bacterium]